MRPFGKKQEKKPEAGISKTKLLLGAAGLLLFIVGVKRSYRLDDAQGTELREGTEAGDLPGPGATAPADAQQEREAQTAPPS